VEKNASTTKDTKITKFKTIDFILETFVSFVIFVMNGINLTVPAYPRSPKTLQFHPCPFASAFV
jgi:hypothetical protein